MVKAIDIKFPLTEYSSERLIFRARAVNQAKELYRLINRNRQNLNPWMPWVEGTRAVEHTLQYIEMISGFWDKGDTFDYSMFDKATNKLIGSFGFHTINWNNKTSHMGYWIDKDFEGKGLITEAIKESEKWARELGFRRLCLTCDARNIRSKNSALRNGFVLEGQFVDEVLSRGEWRDTLRFVKFLNDPVEDQITDNFPFGFSLKECSAEEYQKLTADLHKKVFDDNELILRTASILSDSEKAKLKKLNQKRSTPYQSQAVLFYKTEVAGWTWGFQDSRESYYMVNSAIMPEFRGRGLYKRVLDLTMEKLIQKGFQKIWSRHSILNNAVIIPKLKRGFQITGTELNESFGSLLNLTYLTNETRRKALAFRSGNFKPDEEIKKIFKF